MYTIRKLKDNEVDIVMTIWKESTIKAHSFIPKKYWENNYDVVKNVYIPMAETYVYDEEDKIKGFVSIIEGGFIGALFIDINFQGLGIGSKLIDFVCNKYKKLTLAVYKENYNAVDFYKNKGFKIVSEGKNDDSGFDEYIMELIQ